MRRAAASRTGLRVMASNQPVAATRRSRAPGHETFSCEIRMISGAIATFLRIRNDCDLVRLAERNTEILNTVRSHPGLRRGRSRVGPEGNRTDRVSLNANKGRRGGERARLQAASADHDSLLGNGGLLRKWRVTANSLRLVAKFADVENRHFPSLSLFLVLLMLPLVCGVV